MGKTIQVSGFPYLVAAEAVKDFLENYTGKGTVEALEVKMPRKGGPRAYAKVQFNSVRNAEHIIALAAKKLWYGSGPQRSYLKAYSINLDIAPKPRVYAHEMESINLYFGCQISKERFSVLHKSGNVSVKFGFGLRKMYFILSHLDVEYKLELSYENIWQIELRCPPGRSEFLLIQLLGAPRIYGNEKSSIYSYFNETPDDQWARETDFTPSCSISHSSSLCLEFPHGASLPNFTEYFAYYTENRRAFALGRGSPFSPNPKLAPIVGPPPEIELPYKILFKISTLVQQGCLPGLSLGADFFRLVDPRRIKNIALIENALEKLYYSKECCFEPVKWLTDEYRTYLSLRRLPRTPSIALDSGLVYVRRVQVTPCKVYFCGPEINMSNRVLRHFSEDIDNFLRVSFLDEELDKMHSIALSARSSTSNSSTSKTSVYKRVLATLTDGIVIGDKKFDFLAFSSSQLRENSAWMFASRPGLCAADIREWMGVFSQIRNVAKYAARLGQSFSSSTESLSVFRHEIEVIPDVEVVRGGTRYTFSDGIGKISADLARRVAVKCGLRTTPSALQIRYGGYKGVVAVDPTSSVKLSLRKSMSKYESDNPKLDILAFSKYQPCYLNRQLISLLSTLEIRDHIFEKKQKEAIDELNTILTDPLKAQEALELMSPGENTNILKEMLLCGYKPDGEPFLSMMLQTFRAAKLLELRTKTRIFVPRGRSMMGCLDETRTLEYGQVFVQFSGAGNRTFCANSLSIPGDLGSSRRIIEGKVFVAKNPCLHPGDVRVLQAVNVPALHHMVDCVVFPQKGMRPHPNECSGSDLDGDIYFVCWDPDLIPTKQIQPMDYTPAPTTQLDHDVTIEEVEEYFTNYILNDSLGVIANAHTVFADKKASKAMSPECLKLANLFSIAVDFPKTGVPAEIPRDLRVQEYPDFMEKPDKTSYVSENVIGKLFRQVKDMAPHAGPTKSFFTKEMATRSYDRDMEVDGFEDYIDDAFDYKNEYDFKLGNLMDYYGIKTEAEILGGSIMKMSRTFDRRKDAEAVGLAVRALRKEARTWFNRSTIDGVADDDDVLDAKASAWYHVTYHRTYVGRYNEGMNRPHFLSFPWCVYDRLIRIKKDRAKMRRNLSLLQRQFGNGLSLR